MTRLFCYGTLRRGEFAHKLLSKHDAEFIRECKTHPRYHLYDQGRFPGMVIQEDEPGGVYGELFEVSDECLQDTDYYEGVDSGLFCREEIDIEDGDKAIAYLIQSPFTGTRISSGIWRRDGKTQEG